MENQEASGSILPPTRHEDEERELATTTDPKRRRQIQNRIAQRVYRQKQKRRLQDLEEQASSKKRSSQPDPDSRLESQLPCPQSLTDEQADEYASWTPLAMTYPFANAITRRVSPTPGVPEPLFPELPELATTSKSFSSLNAGRRAVGFHSGAAYDIPSDLKFMAISRVSISNAVLTNLAIIGITPEHYALDDAASPFSEGDSANISLIGHRAPDLAPTRLQLEIQHHPYIDIIPFRGLRDNFLMALDSDALDEGELCADIEHYLRIWGRLVWDARSYEWAPEFVEKWMWLMDVEALNVSNFWRAQRGEPPFGLDRKGKGHVTDDME